MKDKWGTEIDDKEFVDDRTFEKDIWTVLGINIYGGCFGLLLEI